MTCFKNSMNCLDFTRPSSILNNNSPPSVIAESALTEPFFPVTLTVDFLPLGPHVLPIAAPN